MVDQRVKGNDFQNSQKLSGSHIKNIFRKSSLRFRFNILLREGLDPSNVEGKLSKVSTDSNSPNIPALRIGF